MTNEYIAKLGAIRMKHPLTRGAMCWIFTDEQLAGLISEVEQRVVTTIQDEAMGRYEK